tara:strand:+ start:4005 stop:4274 length:270 start_codon:yes stop_codon:yes gene_type:complete
MTTFEILLKITPTKELAGPQIRKAIKDARKGTNLIYYRGAVGTCSYEIIDAAWTEASKLGALVSRPTETFDKNGYRIWDYIIQKHGVSK